MSHSRLLVWTFVLGVVSVCISAGAANVAMYLPGSWDDPEVWVTSAVIGEDDGPLITRDLVLRDARVCAALHGPGWTTSSRFTIVKGGELLNRGPAHVGVGDGVRGCLVLDGGVYKGSDEMHIGRPFSQQSAGEGVLIIRSGSTLDLGEHQLWFGVQGGRGTLGVDGGGASITVGKLRFDGEAGPGAQRFVVRPTADGEAGLSTIHCTELAGTAHATLVVEPRYLPQVGDAWRLAMVASGKKIAPFHAVEAPAGLKLSVDYGETAPGVLTVSVVEAPATPSEVAPLCESEKGDQDWPLTPFWTGEVMRRESVLFIQDAPGERPWAPLLFEPWEVMSVRLPATGQLLEEGRDYIVDASSRKLTLPEGSRVPFKTHAEMYPPLAEKGQPHRNGETGVWFAGGHAFHKTQAEVTYRHAPDAWASMDGYVPEYAGEPLSRTASILDEKGTLRLAVLGDSISRGGDASGFGPRPAPPEMFPYAYLVADELRARTGANVILRNFAVGGTVSDWGAKNASKVAAWNPDLVILAFGMNDASHRVAQEVYAANMRKQMNTIREGNADAEFVLVTTMMGNPEWKNASPPSYAAYRDALWAMAGPGVAVADMTAMWRDLLSRKRFADITDNGVNHPNDFGHRVYAQVLLALLTPPENANE